MNQGIVLTCKRVMYQTEIDEDFFFEWIQRIPSVYKVDGRYDELYLYIKDASISEADFNELVALFKRYKIRNSKQLNILKKRIAK